MNSYQPMLHVFLIPLDCLPQSPIFSGDIWLHAYHTIMWFLMLQSSTAAGWRLVNSIGPQVESIIRSKFLLLTLTNWNPAVIPHFWSGGKFYSKSFLYKKGLHAVESSLLSDGCSCKRLHCLSIHLDEHLVKWAWSDLYHPCSTPEGLHDHREPDLLRTAWWCIKTIIVNNCFWVS